ncbi:acyl-CoA/acyl-ACP dehydrogenase [Klebsiella variicola]|uniref:acyl-CoA dehydrogenase family protein n=1 Tax=Klebsiella variicola TaxID=244366 RepID=UPI0021699503|nr:acyl-CoA dehydrogenase family protein [Klebsiella variicola]UVW51931.1 acyl-CoA/acyl-ACP dehydrogenase [Klebsiella variicola]
MLHHSLREWLDDRAAELDRSSELSHALLLKLAQANLFRIGIAPALGGSGGTLLDAIDAISAVARHSLTAAFMFWGHRTYIDILTQAPQSALCDRILPDLLAGQLAGATGLSNAMKFLSGLEELQIGSVADGKGGWRLSGQLHWVTNLQTRGFQAVTVVQPVGGGEPFIASIGSGLAGVSRSADLALMAMQGSATAALHFDDVALEKDGVIHSAARTFLPAVRPRFLGLQCGMALGLAECILDECRDRLSDGHVLRGEWQTLAQRYRQIRSDLYAGVESQRFVQQPGELFRLRIGLVELAINGIQLELMLAGGRAYLSPQGDRTARRWRECAFLPLVTPSVVQLKQQLARLPA